MTVRGHQEVVVVVSAVEYERLTGGQTGEALIAAMRASPPSGSRHRTLARALARARREPVKGWLLDTNVISELRRPKPEAKVIAFVAAQPLERLHISAVTMAEIRFGIEAIEGLDRRAELDDWLTYRVRPMFEQRVSAISEDVMFRWRVLVEAGRKARHTFSQPDLIIAATALHHGLTVVSRDVRDFEKARVAVLNPWLDRALEEDESRTSRG